ncbi:MAG: hypothetical protein ACRC1Z_08180 [Waterburya sp.]
MVAKIIDQIKLVEEIARQIEKHLHQHCDASPAKVSAYLPRFCIST